MIDNGTNIRIARKIKTTEGALIRTEVLGGWIVGAKEWPKSPKAVEIRRILNVVKTEEPKAGWTLEFRGTERSWHEEGK